jgi:hypothetical protein
MIENRLQRAAVHILVFSSGAAALSWELLWQHFAVLALGVSGGGTAIVLATTMMEVFPDALLWIDPGSGTGVLLGRKGPGSTPLGERWPGFVRHQIPRDLDEQQARAAIRLTPAALRRYASVGAPVTDDNQVLAYGSGGALGEFGSPKGLQAVHEWLLEAAATGAKLR